MNYKNVWGAAGIALASAVGFSVAAQAADLGKRESYRHDEPVYAAPTTWAGGYVGGHLGAVWANNSAELTYDFRNENTRYWGSSSQTHDGAEFIGGVHGGYNWQAGAFVYGVEGDISFANNIDYLASIRGRFGVAANNWLFYGTAGVGFIGTSFSGDLPGAGTEVVHYDASADETGYVVGGGVEVKLAPSVSIGVEALYYGFDGATATNYVDDYTVTATSAADVGVVRARVSYHFNRGYEPLK